MTLQIDMSVVGPGAFHVFIEVIIFGKDICICIFINLLRT